jgi:ribonuclease HI
MELLAVIEGLKALKEPCEVAVVTDSEYVKKGITEWLPKWKERGWKKSAKGKSGGQAVRNQDLWEELDRASQAHTITWEWVRGHAGHKDNSRCDQLALRAAKLQIASRSSRVEAAASQRPLRP